MLNKIKKLWKRFIALDDKYQILKVLLIIMLTYGYVTNQVSRSAFFIVALLECLCLMVIQYKANKH